MQNKGISRHYVYHSLDYRKISWLQYCTTILFLVFLRKLGRARVAQLWQHSPSTSVARVRILVSTLYVSWVCCWYCPLLQEVLIRVLRFSPLLKNQHFRIPIRSGTHGHVSTSWWKLLSAPWVNKLQFQFFFLSFHLILWSFGMNSKLPIEPWPCFF